MSSIKFTISGGTAPFNVLVQSSTYSHEFSYVSTGTKEIPELPSGEYTITVTDSMGCTETIPGIVLYPFSPISIDSYEVLPRQNCADPLAVPPSLFKFMDYQNDDLEAVKILSLPNVGSLTMNGNPVQVNDILYVSNGTFTAGDLIYNVDSSNIESYLINIQFEVKTANNENFG